MSLLLYFYLVHFLADYTFQSSCLVRYKSEHFFGIVIHSTVHLLTLMLFLAPFLPNKRVLEAIAVIYLTHIVIDQTKVLLNKMYPKYMRLFYFLDQGVHMVIVTACSIYVGRLIPSYLGGDVLEIYSNQSIVLYFLVLILATYFFDVSRYFVKRHYKKRAFKRDWPGMGINAGIVTLIFALYWLAF